MITYPAGTVLGSSNNSGGWSVSYANALLTVTAPPNAATGNIEARWVQVASLSAPQPNMIGKNNKQSVFLTVVSPTAPPAPTNLVATPGDTTVSLSWTASSGATSYTVLRGATAGGPYPTMVSSGSNATTASDSGLADGSTYYYIVKAIGPGGTSNPSNEASAIPNSPKPAAPSGLLAQATSGTSVMLTWTDNSSNETGFKIERLGSDGVTWSQITVTAANVTSYVNGGLSVSTAYTYRIRATNAIGDSAYSNVATATTTNGVPLGAGTIGPDFWLCFPPSGSPTGPDHTLSLLISSPTAASGTVTVSSTGAKTNFSIPAGGGGTRVPVDYSQQINQADGKVTAGFHIVSDNPVGINVFNEDFYASEGYTALPTSTLGTSYVLMSYPTDPNARPGLEGYSQLVVLATADGTTVTVTPACTARARAQAVPFTVTLNAGQAYALQATTGSTDLTGSVISADQPVAVYAGCEGAYVPAGIGTANPLIEQQPAVDRWGTDFLVVPFKTRAGDILRVLGCRFQTHVSINGSPVATLSPGGAVNLSLASPSHVTSDQPILVAQLSKGRLSDNDLDADPFMVLLAPSNGYAGQCLFTSSEESFFQSHYANVIAPSSAVGDVTLDGSVIPASVFSPIGSSGYSYAQVQIAMGPHMVTTATTGLPVWAACYGFGEFDGYAYPGSSTLPLNGFDWSLPPAPINLTATAVSTSEIDLTWTNVATNATGVEIDEMSPSQPWTAIATVGPATTTFAASGLTKATQYSFRVRACAAQYSPFSNTATAATWDTAPNPPTNVTAVALQYNQINLTWNDNSFNETGFKVERRGSDGLTWSQIAFTGANATTYTDSNLAGLTTYTYRVRATNAYGDSINSNTASATTLDNPPTAPTSLTASAPAWNAVTLAWTDNANNEQGFYVERETGTSGYVQIASLAPNVVTFTDQTVVGNTSYTYRVRAYNAGGCSAYSNEATVTTPMPPLPTAPSGLTATALSGSQIQLAWTDTSNCEDGFTIQRIGGGVTTWTTVGTAAANATGWTDNGLNPTTTYAYQVCTYNAAGNSSWAGPASATTLAGPSAPPYISVNATSSSSIRVTWGTVAGATAYRIYRSTSSGIVPSPSTLVATVSAAQVKAQNFDDAGLVAEQDYYYVVTALGGAVESLASMVDTHFPNSDAIPWNQSVAQILLAIQTATGALPDDPALIPQGNTIVVEPDGTTVDDVLFGPRPNTFAYNSLLGTMTIDGLTTPTMVDWRNAPNNAQGAYLKGTQSPTGPCTTIGASACFALPAFSANNYYLPAGDAPHAYVGLEADNIGGVEAGVFFAPAGVVNGTYWSNRWCGYLRVAGNPQNYDPLLEVGFGINADIGQPRIPSDTDALIYATLGVNCRTRMATAHIYGYSSLGALIYAKSYSCVAPTLAVHIAGKGSISKPIVKYVVSLAQNRQNGYSIADFISPPPVRGWPGAYVRDGSWFLGSAISSPRMCADGVSYDWWTTTTGWNYMDYPSLPCTSTTWSADGLGRPMRLVYIRH